MNEKIILFDTSIASFNKGDEIIMRSIKHVLGFWLDESDVYYLPTHLQCFSEWEDKHPNYRLSFFKGIKTKFLCGTDIINKRRSYYFGQWDMNYNNASVAEGIVTLAVGYSGVRGRRLNIFTRNKVFKNTERFYSKILNNEMIHSTRDDATAAYINSIPIKNGGYLKAINTGCVTTWMLTPDFCDKINKFKKDSVLFTINCRTRQKDLDLSLINMLLEEYKEVKFWPQQFEDVDYYNELINSNEEKYSKIQIIPMSIKKLQEALINTDYVGLRLHCGIFAMQNKCRALILQADHRSKDISSSQNLNLFSRSNIEEIRTAINSEIITDIHVNYDNINKFLAQFNIELVVDGENVYTRRITRD